MPSAQISGTAKTIPIKNLYRNGSKCDPDQGVSLKLSALIEGFSTEIGYLREF